MTNIITAQSYKQILRLLEGVIGGEEWVLVQPLQKPAVGEKHQHIVDLRLSNPDLTHAEIGRQTGLSRTSITHILNRYGIRTRGSMSYVSLRYHRTVDGVEEELSVVRKAPNQWQVVKSIVKEESRAC